MIEEGMKLFVFAVGTLDDYDQQNAVVLAGSEEQAKEILRANLAAQPKSEADTRSNGYRSFYHGSELNAYRLVAESNTGVVYTYGVDG